MTTPKLHHQVLKINGETYYKPVTPEAIKKSKEYGHNEYVHFKPVSEKDWRSVPQLGLYFSSCKFMSNNKEGQNYETQDKVDLLVRHECHLYDYDKAVYNKAGEFLFVPMLSIAFHNMKHLVACSFFDDAFEFMSVDMGYGGVGDFIDAVKQSMKGNG